ncbi:uncharacterized protein LOC119600195 [Lucilia sericata]|uniref:uncharacterized protein LOC119600195 n=1 Tax=Lucilia sericata TaxID=13632 RepID=UPI0018A80B19|nr:uncharacterized protein LOC119600195 [Lucilia sericata]
MPVFEDLPSRSASQEMPQSNPTPPPAVSPEISSAKTPKLPAFWKDEPEVWFLQVEASFRMCGITQDTTKFEYLVMNLDQSVLFLVKDIIISPPTSGKYETLKERIIKSFAESTEHQLKRLLSGMNMGDQKPSHYLQRMKSLSNGKVSSDILKTLFMERLPDKVKSILAVCETNDVDKLAFQADKIVEAFSSSTSMFVSEVSTPQNADISSKLDNIISRIDALETRSRSSQRTNSSSFKARSRSRGSLTNRKESGLCWYHWRFAEKARKCI